MIENELLKNQQRQKEDKINISSMANQNDEQTPFEQINRITINLLHQDLPKGCKRRKRRERFLNKNKQQFAQNKSLKQTYLNIQDKQQELLTLQDKKKEMQINKLKRQAYLKHMHIVNKNYNEFIKQYKQIKPLYQIKQEQFRLAEQIQFKIKKEKALATIRQISKPINLSQINEHQKRYLRNKSKYQTPIHLKSLQHFDNKKYFRGKSHNFVEQDIKQFKQQFKYKECQSVIKMKQYCQNVLNKARLKMIQKTQLKKQRIRSHTQPIETKILTPQNTISQNPEGLIKININDKYNRLKTQFSTNHSSPIKKLKNTKIKVKDRYDLEQLIYQNQKRDIKINQNQQLVKLGKQINTDKSFQIENDYIGSIKQKLNILSTKC